MKVQVNGENYVKESEIEKVEVKTIEFTGEETISSCMIGECAIIRSRNEGINIGIVVAADETGVVIDDARRIYYHKPLDEKLSWYEGVAVSGLGEGSKISGTVKRKVIVEDYSMTLVSKEVYEQIMRVIPNAQN